MPELYGNKSPNIQAFLASLKGKSPRQQQLMSAFKALGLLPTPMAAEEDEAAMMADLAGLEGDAPITMESLMKKAPKAVEKVPKAVTSEAPKSTADMIKEFLAKKAAEPQAAEAITPPLQAAPQAGTLLQNMETLLKKTGSEGSQNIKPTKIGPLDELASKGVRSTPKRMPAAEEAAARFERNTGVREPVQVPQAVNPEEELASLKKLYDTAFKLRAPGPQKRIEELVSQLTSKGRMSRLDPLQMNEIVLKRRMVQDQLNNLMRAMSEAQKVK